jgi:hypothetical protein
MIVIAGNNHDLASRKYSPKLLEKWTCGSERIATWAVTQLEHVAQQDESIDVLERVEQRGARSGTAQHIGSRAGS